MSRGPSGLERPGHQLIEFLAGMSASKALEGVGHPCEWIDGVELGRFDKAGDDGPVVAAVVGSGEQGVLAVERDGPDGAFDGVAVEFGAAVLDEQGQPGPAGGGIADGLSQLALGAEQGKPGGEQPVQRFDDRLALLLPHGATEIRILPADLVLDGVERLDQRQRLGLVPLLRRSSELMELVRGDRINEDAFGRV